MSGSVTLIKRGETFKIVLKKELWNRGLKETLTLEFEGTLNQNLKGYLKSQFKNNFTIEI